MTKANPYRIAPASGSHWAIEYYQPKVTAKTRPLYVMFALPIQSVLSIKKADKKADTHASQK
jgi:hypothetical protein